MLAMSGSDAMASDLTEKIYAYVERDPPLSPEDQALVHRLLATEPRHKPCLTNGAMSMPV